MLRRSDATDAIERFLAEHGIATYRYEWGGKHPRVVVMHDGRTVRIGFPSTSANYNTRHVVMHKLRYALGLVGNFDKRARGAAA
jgi:hypothetical protein